MCQLICVASFSFDLVKSHIQKYLKNLEENLLDREDQTELYLLFVRCFQVKTPLFTRSLIFSDPF